MISGLGPDGRATTFRVMADGSQPVKSSTYTVLGHQQLTDANLAASVALPSIPANATIAVVQNNGTTAARWRSPGPATSTTGFRIAAGQVLTLDIGQAGLVASRFIRESAGAVLDIVYYA